MVKDRSVTPKKGRLFVKNVPGNEKPDECRKKTRKGLSTYSAAYGNGRFVAFGNRQLGAYSDDGRNWTQVTLPHSDLWDKCTFGNNRFVVIGGGGYGVTYPDIPSRSLVSADGVNWSDAILPVNSGYNSVAAGNGISVAIPKYSRSQSLVSSDGLNWDVHNLPTPVGTVVFGVDRFVGIWLDKAYHSFDGVSWQEHDLPVNSNAWTISYGNGVFFAIDRAGNYLSSVDGVDWVLDPASSTTAWSWSAGAWGKFFFFNETSTYGYRKPYQQQYLAPYWRLMDFVPVGTVVKSTAKKNSIRNYIELEGQMLQRDEYPELFAFAVESGNIVQNNVWAWSKFSYGNGVSTFRVPSTPSTVGGVGREVMKAY